MLVKNLQKLKYKRFFKPIQRQLLAAVFGLLLVLGGEYVKNGWEMQPVMAQAMRPESVAVMVYQRIPDIPKENQYVRQETGKVDPDNTLISRLVRYHQDVKKRATRFRLDWKLTLADYLGINEPIKADRYPGRSSLQTNPLEGDRKAIQSLNRRQREALVDLLANAYQPQQADAQPANPNSNPSSTNPTPTPAQKPTPSSPSLSKPGDAQLLMP
jgi:hypothetical protein